MVRNDWDCGSDGRVVMLADDAQRTMRSALLISTFRNPPEQALPTLPLEIAASALGSAMRFSVRSPAITGVHITDDADPPLQWLQRGRSGRHGWGFRSVADGGKGEAKPTIYRGARPYALRASVPRSFPTSCRGQAYRRRSLRLSFRAARLLPSSQERKSFRARLNPWQSTGL